MISAARPPIPVDSVLDDPSVFRELIERHAPYLPVQRYFSSAAEFRSTSGGSEMLIAPNFRGDWAYDRPLVSGAEVFLNHEGFRDAAAELFGTDLVRPQIVYTNLTWQLPFHQGGGHTDVPAFRGVDRTQFPIWILNVMGHSGLFEEERINMATAVAWFYEGEDGGFEYWPAGGDTAPLRHQGNIFNTAMMGDNDRMYHRVMPVGQRENGLPADMTLDTRLERAGDDRWQIVDAGRELAAFPWSELRISVSWKAQVFRDQKELRKVDEHSHDIGFKEVLERIYSDLAERDIAFERPSDPLRDEAFIDALRGAYVREPSVFSAAA